MHSLVSGAPPRTTPHLDLARAYSGHLQVYYKVSTYLGSQGQASLCLFRVREGSPISLAIHHWPPSSVFRAATGHWRTVETQDRPPLLSPPALAAPMLVLGTLLVWSRQSTTYLHHFSESWACPGGAPGGQEERERVLHVYFVQPALPLCLAPLFVVCRSSLRARLGGACSRRRTEALLVSWRFLSGVVRAGTVQRHTWMFMAMSKAQSGLMSMGPGALSMGVERERARQHSSRLISEA